MNDYQTFIATSRYARWLPEEGRRETWEETVDRYIENVVSPKIYDGQESTQGVLERLELAILNLEVMPSMRAMMTAGKALSRDNTCGYNCSYLPVDDPKSFDEAMFILLCGTGVGFSVERQYVQKLPEVPDLFDSETNIVVQDSKEGWAKAYRQLIALLYAGEIPTWDTSKVRPAGTKLKTFGGRASGPAPLIDLFNFTVTTFKEAQGRKLSSLEAHDLMCKIGEIVVVGGVRRSAMISLSNLSDDRMRHAKTGSFPSHRYLSNNSVAYTEKPDAMSFLREWTALAESGSGERGIFNREASKKQAAKNGRRDDNWEFGTNPCCFTGDMKLLTDEGYKRFDSLVGKEVNIVNNDGNVTKGSVWSSGKKPTVFVSFSPNAGRNPIQVTDDHVFMLQDGTECQAKDLQGKRLKFFDNPVSSYVGTEDFLAGFMLGDANLTRIDSKTHKGLEVFFHREKDLELAEAYGGKETTEGKVVSYREENKTIAVAFNLPAVRIGERGLPSSLWSNRAISGLFSANGSVIKGKRVALKSIDKEQLLKVQTFLALRDIASYITTNKPKKVKFNNGEYLCKESYDLNITRFDSLLNFSSLINFGQTYKREALSQLISERSLMVQSVKEGPVSEVFDFTEPENHWGVVEGVVVHNSEIILRPYQFCNLTEVVVRAEDTLEDLERKVRLATILGTIQSTYTKFPYLRKIWQRNTEEERLLGVSLTGIMDNTLTSGQGWKESGMKIGDPTDLEGVLEHLKQIAVETNAEWATKLGVPVSTAITCVKPSGTVSQLVDSASGIHTRYSPYYIRRVRGDNKDPLTQFMIDKGIPNEPCVYKGDTTTVFSFPMKAPEGAIVTKDVTAIKQLETWLDYQRHWCEHKPSVTINVRPDEWFEVGAFVYEHFDEMSGVSFLPYDDHVYQQAPYEEIGKSDYEMLLATMPEAIDWTELGAYEQEDNTIAMQSLACASGSCEIVDLV